MKVSSLVGSTEGLDVNDDMQWGVCDSALVLGRLFSSLFQRFLRIVQYLSSDVGAFKAAVPVHT